LGKCQELADQVGVSFVLIRQVELFEGDNPPAEEAFVQVFALVDGDFDQPRPLVRRAGKNLLMF
jgi:hypothetical protein